MEAILSQIQVDYAAMFLDGGAQFIIERPLANVWGDRGRIAQLLANLIGNALKYRSPEVPSIVRVSSKPTECGATLIAVTDNGIGIDARHHAAIFQIFKRLHAREEFEGTGAGLAICLKIVQAHAGRIWVESAVGQGSTFFVELPNGPEPVKTTSREAASETSIARGHPHSTSHTPP